MPESGNTLIMAAQLCRLKLEGRPHQDPSNSREDSLVQKLAEV